MNERCKKNCSLSLPFRREGGGRAYNYPKNHKLPKGAIFKKVQYPKPRLPKSVLYVAFGPLKCSSRSARLPKAILDDRARPLLQTVLPNLSFGKLLLGKLYIWEIAKWEFTLGKNGLWENAILILKIIKWIRLKFLVQ